MNPCEEMRKFFIQKFHEQGEAILPFLCESSVSKMVFMAKYDNFPALESLDPAQKTEMKQYVHNMFPGKDVHFKLQAAKTIYVIGSLI